jgi:type 1 glutamine amidotransferase
MKSLSRLLLTFAGLALALSAPLHAADAAALPKKKVLFFSKSSGYEHDAIKVAMKDGKPGYAFPVLKELGAKHNIDFTFTKDGTLITADYLAQFDAYCFFTSGELTKMKSHLTGGLDGQPPMTLEGKAALLKAIAGGKGFVAIHATTDSFHSQGHNEHVPQRFEADGDKTDDFVKMLGGEFIRHGAQQKSRVIVVDPKFPGISAVPADWAPMEEWYSLKNFPADLHAILLQDTKGMKGAEYERAPYPSTWARMHGKGRVFYTSLGHRDDIWNGAIFQSILVGGLNWATGRVEADVTPNLGKVAPQANVLPKYVAPPPPAPKKDAAPKKN